MLEQKLIFRINTFFEEFQILINVAESNTYMYFLM